MSSNQCSQAAIVIGMTLIVQNPDFQHWRRKLVGSFAGVWWRTRIEEHPSQPRVSRQGLYRVLICRPDHRVDNLLLLMPLIAELQLAYPGTQVDLIVGGSSASNDFRRFQNVGQIYSLPHHALRHPWKFLNVIRKFRRQHYDLAIDPDISSKSGRMLTNRCRATCRIGFSGTKASGKLTCSMPFPTSTMSSGEASVLLLRWALARSDSIAGP